VTLFTGEGGAGKTTAAIQMGISIAAGMPWLGYRTVQRHRQNPPRRELT
jgi:RecA-family ATPase